MPIYEYQCRVCQHKFEVLQKLGEDGKGLKCPKCGADKPIKIFSVFASGTSSGNSSSTCTSKGFT
ncbi:MAG: zinc ribbon domain-containing protein [candidate division Zixibacteria bacterium]|nr:zinc ribbon domain-containing protein [candidate division Zixibacteria bacterium]